MKIELLGALDYNKLKEALKDKVENREEIVEIIKNLERERKAQIISSTGRLSRFMGNIFEILDIGKKNSFKKNTDFIKRVIKMGHDSTIDHDYLVFAIQDASILVEQTVIEERFSSFTVKSRREVDFAKVGFYTPDFHDENRNVILNNSEAKKEYKCYMENLFLNYEKLTDKKIDYEDARFILPYSYYSNFFMGINAHTLKDLIIKLTKKKYANIQELREFGEYLYAIAQEKIPYIIDQIDQYQEKRDSKVEEFLRNKIKKETYKIIDQVKMLNHSVNIDDNILIAAIMRRYQYDYNRAKKLYEQAVKDYPQFKYELMKKIAFEDDQLELTQVNFEFQIPISFAVLTHLTRHGTHHIMIPDFAPNIDLRQYKIPPTIKSKRESEYRDIYNKNVAMYNHFKNDLHICEEDLVHFTLSGNQVNVITNMDGKTVKHILSLRECNKAQWEMQAIAHGIHREIDKLEDAYYFSSVLGPSCETQGICNEGKECCGKVYYLQKKPNNKRYN